MKKIITVLIIFMMVIVSLYGCTNIKEEGTNSSTTKTDTSIQKDTSSTSLKPNNISTDNNVQNTQQPVVLFRGIPIDVNDRKVNIFEEKIDASKKQQLYEKYEREYYLYSNGTLLGKANGKIVGRGLDYYWDISFIPNTFENDEVAISQQYNPYPRQAVYTSSNFQKEFDVEGKAIKQVNNQFNVNSTVIELCCVDLDGDGKNEYIAFVLDEKNYFFAKCLFNSNYDIIA